MKYRVAWLDYAHNDESLKRMLAELPNSKHTGELIGDYEVEAWDTFEAKNNDEAKDYIRKNFNDLQIFNCDRKKGQSWEQAFTEEDM